MPVPCVKIIGTSGTVYSCVVLSWVFHKRILQVVAAFQMACRVIVEVVTTVVLAIDLDRPEMAVTDQRRVVDIARPLQILIGEWVVAKQPETIMAAWIDGHTLWSSESHPKELLATCRLNQDLDGMLGLLGFGLIFGELVVSELRLDAELYGSSHLVVAVPLRMEGTKSHSGVVVLVRTDLVEPRWLVSGG